MNVGDKIDNNHTRQLQLNFTKREMAAPYKQVSKKSCVIVFSCNCYKFRA